MKTAKTLTEKGLGAHRWVWPGFTESTPLADYCLVLAALGLFLPATSCLRTSPVNTFAWVLQTREAFQQVL